MMTELVFKGEFINIFKTSYENAWWGQEGEGAPGVLLIVLPRSRDLEEVINLLVVDKTPRTLDNDYKKGQPRPRSH